MARLIPKLMISRILLSTYRNKSDANTNLSKKTKKNDDYNDKSEPNTNLPAVKINNSVSYKENFGKNKNYPTK